MPAKQKANREKITFLASLPPVQSAIMVDGNGDTMTVKLQIPLNRCPQALRMNLMTQKVLRVTVEEEENVKVPARQERKSKWSTA
jgi:hypothetical protein